ncbi:putative membrane protein [Escherichia coli TW14301]|nr:putative membrane protein [Escherichia coli TW14301]EKW59665.1 putative membrane protein [Escherichia coli 96.0932]ELW15853.1 putative membrane protein [Escherichia coli 7.1982]ERE36739.1 putative membrane protein [Escherichia coli Tx1686]
MARMLGQLTGGNMKKYIFLVLFFIFIVWLFSSGHRAS